MMEKYKLYNIPFFKRYRLFFTWYGGATATPQTLGGGTGRTKNISRLRAQTFLHLVDEASRSLNAYLAPQYLAFVPCFTIQLLSNAACCLPDRLDRIFPPTHTVLSSSACCRLDRLSRDSNYTPTIFSRARTTPHYTDFTRSLLARI